MESPIDFHKFRDSFSPINFSDTNVVADTYLWPTTSVNDFSAKEIKKWCGVVIQQSLKNKANPLCGSVGSDPSTQDDTLSGYDIQCDFSQNLISESETLAYRNREKIEKYLEDHPNIKSYISSILPHIRKFFGPKAKVVLELMEFKTEKPFNELVAWIQFSGNLDDGLARFDKFEDDFLLHRTEEFSGTFNFNIEFN